MENNRGHLTYRFAVNENGKSVDATLLGNADRKDYTCISCNSTVRPVLGQIRVKHFRHYHQQVNCSHESYLHSMAKKVFFETYSGCLKEKRPYLIVHKSKQKCKSCEFGPCEIRQCHRDVDLTAYYQAIELEKENEGFRPDLLLIGNNEQVMFIEIAVTHFSEEKKLESGVKIIEITIDSEDDIAKLAEPSLSTSLRYKLVNFKIKDEFINYSEQCKKDRAIFCVHNSGKVVVTRMNVSNIKRDELSSKYPFVEILDENSREAFFTGLLSALEQGIYLKNCFACRYAARNHQYSDEALPIFCKYRKEKFASNDASSCPYYRQDVIAAQKTIMRDF